MSPIHPLAVHLIDDMIIFFANDIQDVQLCLKANFSPTNQESELLATSLHRELAYAFEHGIHHQTLIKIALLKFNETIILSEPFGIAPATIRHYRENLADR